MQCVENSPWNEMPEQVLHPSTVLDTPTWQWLEVGQEAQPSIPKGFTHKL